MNFVEFDCVSELSPVSGENPGYRRRLTQVAALAVAAMQSFDRKRGFHGG